MEDYSCLKLKNQLCFPLYSVANLIIRNYKPLLDEINLTYTQYIAMMVLWEKGSINEKELCDSLYLKTNTLAPLIKRLEEKGYIKISKSRKDKRNIIITLTEKGELLKDEAKYIPSCIMKEFNLTMEEATFFYKIMYKILNYNKED